MPNRFLGIEFKSYGDGVTSFKEKGKNLWADCDLVMDTLIPQLSAAEFGILIMMVMMMDEKFELKVTTEEIAAKAKMSKTTACKMIQSILKLQVNGEPLLERKYKVTRDGRVTVYKMNGMEDDVAKEETPKKRMTPKDVIVYFQDKYREKYNVTYNPSWGRDTSQVKSKLIECFSDSEIKAMINIVFQNYDRKWGSKDFPRPSITQLCTWLGNQAMTLYRESQKKQEQIEQRERINVDEFVEKARRKF